MNRPRPRVASPERQALLRLLTLTLEEMDRDFVDIAVEMDLTMADLWDEGRLEMALGRLDDALAIPRSETELEASMFFNTTFPEGPSARAYLTWMRDRMATVLADPGLVPHLTWEQRTDWRHTRQSRFLRVGVVDRVAELVLDRCEEQLDAWMDGDAWQGFDRIHLYADLADHVEEIGGPGASGIGEVAPLIHGQVDISQAVPVSHAVVVVQRGSDGRDEVLEAHPEIELDLGLRSAYPALVHWFGGFQTAYGDYPTKETMAANRATMDPARSQVRDQLTLLLTQDDVTIHEVLVATGSYTVPSGPLARHWVDRQLWRLDAWDWSDPRA